MRLYCERSEQQGSAKHGSYSLDTNIIPFKLQGSAKHGSYSFLNKNIKKVYSNGMRILISGLKIFIILVIIIGGYIIFSQAPISYVTDHMYFYVYVGEELIEHYWFKDITETYTSSVGAFHFKEKSRFIVKKLYAYFLKKNFVGHGYIDLSQIVKLLQDNIEMTFSDLVPFSVYISQDSQYLFFILDISDITFPMLLDNNTVRYNDTSDQSFVLVLRTDTSLEDFEKKIKSYLALYTPVEKRVVLPDGSTFIEVIADIDVFDFKDKVIDEKRVRYWEDDNKRVVLWKDKNYIFVSNNLEENQNFISMCFSNLEDTEFKQAVYVQLDAYGIEDIIMGEGDRKLEGCLKLVSQQEISK
ncbi:hypothetical protein MYX06_00940 [Patescibacteria group bacterium AH-259-L05]|nr:hypothetical protein [Patescibacteria group bacterium AH-259-L05]